MRVLVTGGAGYIGSHAVRALARHGHQVHVYDNLSTGIRSFANGFPLTIGDIADRSKLLKVLPGTDVIMHFAASAYIDESVQNPRKYFNNNVQSALVLLDTALDCGVRAIVFSSTCATYGIPPALPITEDTPQLPVNPYGTTKLLLEKALQAYDHAYGLKSACLRYFNAAGADDSGDIGEMHDPETHLIPCALQVAAKQRRELSIFGNDYNTKDGTCVRDYIHVADLADAHVKALDYVVQSGRSVALNLGTGKGSSNFDVINAVEKITGSKLKIRFAPRRIGDPPELVADSSLAKQLLHWEPTRNLDQMVSSAWRFATTHSRL